MKGWRIAMSAVPLVVRQARMVLKLAIDARKFLSAAKFSRSIFIFLLPGGPRASSLPPPLARGVGTMDRPHPLLLRLRVPEISGTKNPEGAVLIAPCAICFRDGDRRARPRSFGGNE